VIVKIAPERLLGIALIAGGALVGVVVIVLLSGYARNGGMTAVAATIGVVIAFLLFVLPQFAFGVYLIWHDARQIAPDDEI